MPDKQSRNQAVSVAPARRNEIRDKKCHFVSRKSIAKTEGLYFQKENMQTEKRESLKQKFNKEFLIFYIEQIAGIFSLMLGYLIGVRLPYIADLVAGGAIALASIVYCLVQHDNDRNKYGYINPAVVSFACGMVIAAYFSKFGFDLFFGNYPVFLMAAGVVTLNLSLMFFSSKLKGYLFLIPNTLSALLNVATIVFAIIALCQKSNEAFARANSVEFGLIFLYLGLVVLGETIYLLFGGEFRVMLNLFCMIAFSFVFLMVSCSLPETGATDAVTDAIAATAAAADRGKSLKTEPYLPPRPHFRTNRRKRELRSENNSFVAPTRQNKPAGEKSRDPSRVRLRGRLGMTKQAVQAAGSQRHNT